MKTGHVSRVLLVTTGLACSRCTVEVLGGGVLQTFVLSIRSSTLASITRLCEARLAIMHGILTLLILFATGQHEVA